MSDKLPVARCGDCLYWTDPRGNIAAECVKALPEFDVKSGARWPVTNEDAWCGEFIHRTLGARLDWEGDPTEGKFIQQWRFPTEEAIGHLTKNAQSQDAEPQDTASIEVTEGMVEAGVNAFHYDPDLDFPRQIVQEVYVAMERARIAKNRDQTR